uniref:Gustatory receptor n=1 Tax=Meteorus pulchricornis TaxID=51522 RepID=A0A346TLL4_9HYME|nr:gustatory receptor [Meteorus pulchricornis]
MADKGPINYSPIYFLYLQALMIEIQYTIATYNLNERFLRLNRNLENLMKNHSKWSRIKVSAINDISDGDKLSFVTMKTGISDEKTKLCERVLRTSRVTNWMIDNRGN